MNKIPDSAITLNPITIMYLRMREYCVSVSISTSLLFHINYSFFDASNVFMWKVKFSLNKLMGQIVCSKTKSNGLCNGGLQICAGIGYCVCPVDSCNIIAVVRRSNSWNLNCIQLTTYTILLHVLAISLASLSTILTFEQPERAWSNNYFFEIAIAEIRVGLSYRFAFEISIHFVDIYHVVRNAQNCPQDLVCPHAQGPVPKESKNWTFQKPQHSSMHYGLCSMYLLLIVVYFACTQLFPWSSEAWQRNFDNIIHRSTRMATNRLVYVWFTWKKVRRLSFCDRSSGDSWQLSFNSQSVRID